MDPVDTNAPPASGNATGDLALSDRSSSSVRSAGSPVSPQTEPNVELLLTRAQDWLARIFDAQVAGTKLSAFEREAEEILPQLMLCIELPGVSPPDQGWQLIAAERARQQQVEGWTPEHDDTHTRGELARAASVYALQHTSVSGRSIRWPWERGWFKPSDPIRNLVKAGALIAAEIDRLRRLPAPPEVNPT